MTLPMGTAATRLFEQAHRLGHGADDTAVLVNVQGD